MNTPHQAIAAVPPGRWAIGVSGGADSIALACLMAGRADCSIVVVHLNHQLRGEESDGDAAFVAELARQLAVPIESAVLSEIASSPPPLEGGGGGRGSAVLGRATDESLSLSTANPLTLPSPSRGEGEERCPIPQDHNPSARYRSARFAWFADVVRRHQLDGVLLAHHADDQAETVLLQLLRGRGLAFLGGIRAVQTIHGLVVRRPLLGVRRAELRDYLATIHQPWREDASNASPKYRRNVLRKWLATHESAIASSPPPLEGGGRGRGFAVLSESLSPIALPSTAEPLTLSRASATPPSRGEGEEGEQLGNDGLTVALLGLAAASQRWHAKLEAASPVLSEAFACEELRIPLPLAEHAARRWLTARGAPSDRVSPAVCRRLIQQATDVTKPPRQHYPGNVLVRRRAKRIDVIPSPPLQSRHTHGQETAPIRSAAEDL